MLYVATLCWPKLAPYCLKYATDHPLRTLALLDLKILLADKFYQMEGLGEFRFAAVNVCCT